MKWTALYDKCAAQLHYYHIFRCGAHVQNEEVIDGFTLRGTHFSRMWSEGAMRIHYPLLISFRAIII